MGATRGLATSFFVSVLVLAGLELAGTDSAAAATIKTFVSGNQWSTATWSPAGAPITGDSVVLPAGSITSNDIAGLVINDITSTGEVTTGAPNPEIFSIGGNVHAQVDPTNLDHGLHINAPHLTAAVHTFNVDDRSRLVMDPGLTGDGDIVKTGAGLADLAGDFTGDLDVTAGTVVGNFGLPAGKTILRAGTTAGIGLGNPTEPFDITPGSVANPTRLVTISVRSGPLTMTGAGEFVIPNSWGDVTSLISGPGHLTLTEATTAGDLTIDGTNTYTGGTSISAGGFLVAGSAPLGTGDVSLDGPGPGGAVLNVLPGTTLANNIVVNNGEISISDGGVAAQELSGDITVNAAQSTMLVAQVDPLGGPAGDLSGSLKGAGVLDLESVTDSASVLLSGTTANTNGGVKLATETPLKPVTLVLAKTAGVNAISHSLTIGASDVRWLDNEQIDDAATVSVGFGALFLNGATETMGNTSVSGGGLISLSDFDSTTSGQLSFGNLTASPDSVISMVVDDDFSDHVDVRGTASIGGAILDLLPLVVSPGQFHTLFSVAGTQPVIGTFDGLPEGATLDVGGSTFEISYRAGDGNDIVIGPVGATSLPLPEPPTPPVGPPIHSVSPVRVLETRVSQVQVGYSGPLSCGSSGGGADGGWCEWCAGGCVGGGVECDGGGCGWCWVCDGVAVW